MNLSTVLSMSLQNQVEPTNLSFLAYLDIWLIGGLVLLAVVVVTGKWIWGRLRRPPDEIDEHYYYEDDEHYPDDDYRPGNR